MPHILSLAAGTHPEFSPSQIADAAGAAGFSHVGFTIEPEKWNADELAKTKSAIARHGLSVLDTEVIWIPEGGEVTDEHKRIVEAGAELGARNLLVVSSEPDHQATASALNQLCELAAPAKIRVALEFLMITAIRTLGQAREVVRLCDHPAAAILIDTLHFQRAGQKPADLDPVRSDLLPYAQFCDGALSCGDDFKAYLTDAVDLRSCPGEGELPLNDILDHLPNDIPLSLEIRSKALRDGFPDAVDRAVAVKEIATKWFAAHNIAVA